MSNSGLASTRGKYSKKKELPEELKIQEYQFLFNHFDKDGSGFMDMAELGDLMRSLGHNPTQQELEDIIQQNDKDGNKKIDFEEFKVLMNKRKEFSSDITDEEIIDAFRTFDKEGIGFLSKNYIKHIMTHLGEIMTDEEADEILSEADVDADGQINYIEFFNTINKKLLFE